MTARFVTMGPFDLARTRGFLDAQALQKIWTGDPALEKAIGVYVIASKNGKNLLPLYVGKSNRSFGSRLNKHSIFTTLAKNYPKDDLCIFLIARVTTARGDYKTATRKVVRDGVELQKLKSIDRLEFALIGTCLTLNKNLLNEQNKKFLEGLDVPGYLPNNGRYADHSATALSRMLYPPRKKGS